VNSSSYIDSSRTIMFFNRLVSSNIAVVILYLALPSKADIGDKCRGTGSNVAGTCQYTSRCTSGFTTVGDCPEDPNDIRCCITTSCKSNKGICLDKSVNSCSGGHYEKGYCPGGNDIQCCISDSTCPTYMVIGVRGSEEPNGIHVDPEIEKMGITIAKYIGSAYNKFPAGTEFLGLPYPAELSEGLTAFYNSEEAGWVGLEAVIQARVKTCPNIQIAVAGYSQGAMVVNDALRWLASNAPSTIDNIQAVLLLADPKADSSQSYHAVVDFFGGGPVAKDGNDGILGAQALPSALRSRASSLCISGDLVCDTSDNVPAEILQLMVAYIHTEYIDCCGEFAFWSILGGQLANRLLS